MRLPDYRYLSITDTNEYFLHLLRRVLFQKPFGSTANPIGPAIAGPSVTPPPQRHRTAAARGAVAAEEYTLP